MPDVAAVARRLAPVTADAIAVGMRVRHIATGRIFTVTRVSALSFLATDESGRRRGARLVFYFNGQSGGPRGVASDVEFLVGEPSDG